MKKFANSLFRIYIRAESIPLLETLRRAFTFLVPVFLIGAGALVLQNFPVTAAREFIQTAAGGSLNCVLSLLYSITYGFSAVYLAIALSFFDTARTKIHSSARLAAAVCALACYLISLGPDIINGEKSLLEYTKMSNIFPAILISLLSTRLFLIFYNFIKKRHPAHTEFSRSMQTVFPLFFCLVIFGTFAEIITAVRGSSNFNDLLTEVFAAPFADMGAAFIGGFLVMFFESLLWFFGIHGSNVFDELLTSPTSVFAFSNGQIMSKPFIDAFVLIGGCGTAVSLFIALSLFSKDRHKKRLCRVSALPLFFNINELLIFGIPVVLNPVYVIPLIITPLVSYSISYAALAVGLVPPITNAAVLWTTPVLISGYRATGNIAGSVLQIAVILMGVAIYTPFVLLENKVRQENRKTYLDRLVALCKECEINGTPYNSDDEPLILKAFEDEIVSKLNSDISKESIGINYQPQVVGGKIKGAEALLRFSIEDAGHIYPPLIVGIASSRGLFDPMTRVIVKTALRDLKSFQQILPDFRLTVNIQTDLLLDEKFRNWLIEEVAGSGVTPETFGVEITEDSAFSERDVVSGAFEALKDAKIEIFMDDFSMGHTAISLLRKNYFNYIKIDGHLIRDLDNERSQSIVASIIELGKGLNFKVIAEYVETEKQRKLLEELGCTIYQGYLYYKDMPAAQLKNLLEDGK